MAQEIFALGDVGATQTRLVLKDLTGQTVGELNTYTDASDYEASVNEWANHWQSMAGGRPIIAAALAIAASVDHESGQLLQAGGLTPWLGQRPAHDLGHLLNIEVGARNDVEAIAASQQYINRKNNQAMAGLANTLSSGWGAARYDDGHYIQSDEPGHEFLRSGAECPCGEDGHAEAWIAGVGKLKNANMKMEDWLLVPGNATELAADISTAIVSALNRHEQADNFWPDELRWTGGVALGQPFIMQDVAERVRHELGRRAPAFDTATMGSQAGIHGSFVYARELADAA